MERKSQEVVVSSLVIAAKTELVFVITAKTVAREDAISCMFVQHVS